MMSAKTVFTDAPACPPASSSNSATASAAPGDAATEFQNLLAAAVPPVDPLAVEAMPAPAPSPAQLMLIKYPLTPGKNGPAPTAAPAAVKPAATEVSPAEMLKILADSATLLPEGGEVEVKAEIPEELVDADELAKTDDEVICDWLESMMPVSVFAPQAGSTNPGDVSQGQGGGAEAKTGSAGVPVSLTRQALVPEQAAPDAAAPGAAPANANANAAAKPELLAGAQNVVTAFAASLHARNETTEKDKPSADGWMSALGDLAAKRGHDVAPTTGPRLSTPVHDARWADALAHRLVMMARDGESTASLKLVPVDLGPLDIQITVRDGEASVHFGAAHQETRAVLEASLPRLRELLGAQGLQLANASVSQQSGGQNRPEKTSGPAAIGAVADDTEVATAKSISTSLLDIYA